MNLKQFWYIIAHSGELKSNKVLSKTLLNEKLVCFRGPDGQAAVLQDRCLHRQGKLSAGKCAQGVLTCPYHGWQYNHLGQVIRIPAMDAKQGSSTSLKAISYETREQEGYVYVRLQANPKLVIEPHAIPFYQQKGWKHIRLANLFENNLNNCIENFIDIPHTAYVHKKLFRVPRQEKINATITRKNGSVHVSYLNERSNLGLFSKICNPKNLEVVHTDTYFMPNITSVHYKIGKVEFIITSQSVPITDQQTEVFTDLSFKFGIFNPIAPWFVKPLASKVIDQDKVILREQMEVLNQYGKKFINTSADKIHHYVDTIIQAINDGVDPASLPDEETDIEFYV